MSARRARFFALVMAAAMAITVGVIADVVARLAKRTGVRVMLRSAPNVGTAAVVSLPASIVRRVNDADTVDLVAEEGEGREPAPSVVDVRHDDGADPSDPSSGVPTHDRDLASTPEPAPDLSTAAVAADSSDLPKRFDATEAGLPRRRPAATSATDSSVVEPALDVAAPPNRPAGAVFEFVARFEAGRRRAQTDEPNPEGDEP